MGEANFDDWMIFRMPSRYRLWKTLVALNVFNGSWNSTFAFPVQIMEDAGSS